MVDRPQSKHPPFRGPVLNSVSARPLNTKELCKLWWPTCTGLLTGCVFSLSRSLKTEEAARVAAQKTRLGDQGLQELETKLANAKAENAEEIPKNIITGFRVPDTSSIHFIPTTTARSGLARQLGRLENPIQSVIDCDDTDLGLFIHFEHVETNFVHLTLLVGTETIPVALRPLLSVYLENFFNSPISRDGQVIEFEQVIMELERDTVNYR